MSNIAKSDKIYLDYASTTPIDNEVLAEMIPYFSPEYSNPSSMYESGRRAKEIIENTRAKVANLINTSPNKIIFTGSGTESDNLAILGIARAYKAYGNHIIVSAIEHKAVLAPTKALKNEGFEVSILPVDIFGTIDIKACLKLIRKETILISVIYANNEIGTVEPIEALTKLIKEHRRKFNSIFPIVHTDACQAAGYLSLDIENLGVDLMTLNSSKIYGPKGVGMLFKKEQISISPILLGGEQEKNRRAGTENIALIFGFGMALEKAEEKRLEESKRLRELQTYFIDGLMRKIPDIKLNGHPENRLPNNIHVSIPQVEGESMLLMLDSAGIEASTGSACSAFDLKPSHVLLAIKQDENIIHGSLRFTMGRYTKKSDIDSVLYTLPPIVKKLKEISAIRV